jgi:uncharacterized lipoprotein YajG
MPSQRLRLAGTLTGLALLAGCASQVTTQIETTGMANPEVVLRRVLLQTLGVDVFSGAGRLVHAATPNRLATKAACAFMS